MGYFTHILQPYGKNAKNKNKTEDDLNSSHTVALFPGAALKKVILPFEMARSHDLTLSFMFKRSPPPYPVYPFHSLLSSLVIHLSVFSQPLCLFFTSPLSRKNIFSSSFTSLFAHPCENRRTMIVCLWVLERRAVWSDPV